MAIVKTKPKSKVTKSRLKAGKKKKVNKWLIVGFVAAVAAVGGFYVYRSQAAAYGFRTFKNDHQGTMKVCKYYGKSGGYVLRANVIRKNKLTWYSYMKAGSERTSDGQLKNIRFESGDKDSWLFDTLQSYDMPAPTRYMQAYLVGSQSSPGAHDRTKTSGVLLISNLPNCPK